MVARLALLVCCVVAGGCIRENADHCGNRDGDLTCQQLGGGKPYCSICEPANDGCVDARPEVACLPADGSASVADTAGESVTSIASQDSGSTASATTFTSTSQATDGDASASTTLPGDTSGSTGGTTCGDGIRDAGEACDGEDLGGTTCESLGLGEGRLACNRTCTAFDVDGCENVALCGNGNIEVSEDCDGDNLGGMTCAAFPEFASGELSCDQNCMFNTTNCAPCKTAATACEEADECCSESCGGLGVCL